MTTATKAGGAVLPVVAHEYTDRRDGYRYVSNACASETLPEAIALTPHEPAQATIDELRAEVERLTRERDELRAARFAYASEFPLNADGEPDIGSIHANIRALKAKQIDVDAVMRLAEDYAQSVSTVDLANGEVWRSDQYRAKRVAESDAAREALRAALLGDGGTL